MDATIYADASTLLIAIGRIKNRKSRWGEAKIK
jgi:hypothetical protein